MQNGAVGIDLQLKGDGISIRDEVAVARDAAAAGFGRVWHSEAYREALIPLAAVAMEVPGIGIGTSVAQWTRSVPNMELAAANLHEMSGGNFILGLGSMPKSWNEDWHGIRYERPLLRMREYIEALRVLWTAGTRNRVDYEGEIFRISNYFRFNGPLEGTIPIYLGVTRSQMARLAGTIADGVLFNSQLSAGYIRDVMAPEVEAARVRAGRPEPVATLTTVPTAISDDRDAAFRAIRRDIAMHIGETEYLGGVIAFHGFDEPYAAVTEAWRAGRIDEAIDAVTDEMVDTFGLAGTLDEVREKIESYAGSVDRIILSTPGFTEGDVPVIENYRAILEIMG